MNAFPWLTTLGVVPLVGASPSLLGPAAPGVEPLRQAGRARLGVSLRHAGADDLMALQFKPDGAAVPVRPSSTSGSAQFGVALRGRRRRHRAGPDRDDRDPGAGRAARVLATTADRRASARRVKAYFALLLVLETMMIGVFAATDVFLFYVFFEAMLIPVYFLIGGFGGRAAVVRRGEVPAVQPARRAAHAGRA